jgi:hypothetical protein
MIFPSIPNSFKSNSPSLIISAKKGEGEANRGKTALPIFEIRLEYIPCPVGIGMNRRVLTKRHWIVN